ncbi:hypothetical protein PDIP_74020 [Penicillium digitatum Pd1]|uniref:Uncharacterized protein n=1 Tax=Penicillium digitatum (strain Pd1 / CECT 20795) TaxID=1170230 RepID=K9G203_PEND1|nr:hypothetical protein PDIP_74020 [Penicillium digitatum Pd1]EKV07311.1 hypothetical protein PDIP_74020 [Penicillium digitatum Pd1]
MSAAYKSLEKSKGKLDHCSQDLRRTCIRCCWTQYKSSGPETAARTPSPQRGSSACKKKKKRQRLVATCEG